jgi:hypothetical protein
LYPIKPGVDGISGITVVGMGDRDKLIHSILEHRFMKKSNETTTRCSYVALDETIIFPILDNICRIAHQGKECVEDLFVNPDIAWKIAGLPKQDGVHFVTMDGSHFFMEPYC